MSIDITRFRLKSMSFMNMLEPANARYARQHLTIRKLKKGQLLFKEGTYSKGVYIVRSGRVKIYHTSEEGRESILYLYKRGEFFGYRPLLGEEPHPISAAALDSAEVYFLPAEQFQELLKISETLPGQLLTSLSKEFSVWVNKLTVFSQFAVKERVALSLLLLTHVYGTEGHRKPSVSIGRDELASFVGTAKETVVRMLRVFKDAKIISSKGSRITINKPEMLHEFLAHI
jgi:CRP-like cAMP-binding protein